MFIRTTLLPLLFLCCLATHAQDISGTWTGNYAKKPLMVPPKKVVVELFIQNDSIVTGATHLYYKNDKYEHYKINGVYHSKDSSISFSEDSTISVKLGALQNNSLGNYKMTISADDTMMYMKGKWKDNAKGMFHLPTTGVHFEKAINGPIAKKVITPVAIENVLARKTSIQSLIEIQPVERDSIKIEIYDNGNVDGDSVSVFYNDSILLYKKAISIKPHVFYLQIGKDDPLSKLKLVAVSLGSVPPCTALVVVTTKLKRYDVHLSGNFSENATIEFFQKEGSE